jgi:hypothetical protein
VNCPGCVIPGNFIDTLTEVSSHELCEAITDPAGSTWRADNVLGPNEIGDICNFQAARLGGYLIQSEWSNEQSACVIAPPGALTKDFAPVYAQGDPDSPRDPAAVIGLNVAEANPHR